MGQRIPWIALFSVGSPSSERGKGSTLSRLHFLGHCRRDSLSRGIAGCSRGSGDGGIAGSSIPRAIPGVPGPGRSRGSGHRDATASPWRRRQRVVTSSRRAGAGHAGSCSPGAARGLLGIDAIMADPPGEAGGDQAEPGAGVSAPPRGRQRLEALLNRSLRIRMSDGRTLVGAFLCTDRQSNVILGSAQEFLKAADAFPGSEPRVLGLAMVPGHHIVSIEVEPPYP